VLKSARVAHLAPLRCLWSGLLVAVVTFVAQALEWVSRAPDAQHAPKCLVVADTPGFERGFCEKDSHA